MKYMSSYLVINMPLNFQLDESDNGEIMDLKRKNRTAIFNAK